eukprot:TRINITY_DN897_c0_g1_i1.p1 TRINITY_DN897_c0_g1~~TRINITY_DN897_c0_g1_i1.p1  ORF type:complete len:193 (+),score=58.15 TRINITY_DN897_c0_g1_i1:27-581(+)
MDFLNLIKSRSSCRQYTDDIVPQEDIENIMECALSAPSACNFQKWRFKVCTNREINNRISRVTEDNLPNGWDPIPKRRETLGVNEPIFCDAPVVVYCFINKASADWNEWQFEDMGFACENLLLAAEALGYKGLPVGLVKYGAEEIVKQFGKEDETFANLCIVFGRPQNVENKPKKIKVEVEYYN